MPSVDTGGAKTGGPRRRLPKPKPAPTAPPRNADTGDTSRARPAPKPKVVPVFKGPATVTRPFAGQQTQATQQVRSSRRRLPVAPIAAPPVVVERTTARGSQASGAPLTAKQVKSFLANRTETARHAREQIVGSIRKQVAGSRGQERVDRIDALLDEIATDPRHAATRKAIRHYTKIEAETTRPQGPDVAKPGKKPRRAVLGPASINLTAVSTAVEHAAAKAAPGLQGHTGPQEFVKNAIQDVGSIGTAPFVGGYQTIKAAASDVAHLRDPLHGHLAQLNEDVAKGIVQNYAHPGQYFREHPVLFALDLAGAASVVGHGAGAAARAVGKTGAPGLRGRLADVGSTVRPPLALGEDAAAGHVERRYSKDLIRKAVQAASDRGLEPLRDAQGQPVTVEQAGRRVVVLKPKEGVSSAVLHPRVGAQGSLNLKRGDVLASRANAEERIARDQEGRARKVRGVRGKATRAVVALVVRGVVTSGPHFQTDLAAYLARLRGKLAQHDMEVAANQTPTIYRHEGEVEAARANADLVNKVLRSPRALAQAERIVAEGVRHGGALVAHDTEAAAAGLFEGGAEQARRARLVETAVEHLGAQHYTVEEHRALERAALNTERAAADKYRQAKTPAERATALSELNAAREDRIAVSGRDPDKVRAHENARVAHHAAQQAVKAARDFEARAEQRVRTLAAVHKSERGKEAHHGPVAAYHVTHGHGPHPATVDVAYNSGFGVKRIMESSDLSNVRSFHLPPDRTHGASGTHRLSPKQVAAIDRKMTREGFERVDHPDGSTTWRRPTGAMVPITQRFALLKDAVAHAKANGTPIRDIQRVALTSGEAKRVGELSQARRAGRAARQRTRAADAHVKKTAKNLNANPLPETNAGLRRGPGSPRPGENLYTDQIEDFLRSRGRDPNTVAYLPPNVTRRQFHKQFRPGSRGTLTGQGTRTGEQARRGAVENSAEILRAAGVRHVTTLNKVRAIDRLIGEHGMVHPAVAKAKAGHPLTGYEQKVVDRGGYYTGHEAAEVIDRTAKGGEPKYVAVRAYPGKLDAATQKIIREDLQGPGSMDTLGQRLLNDRFLTDGELRDTKTRNVVLVDANLINRLEAHLRPSTAPGKLAQIVNRAFRYAVLPQLKWVTGEFFEPLVVRLTASGSGLNVFGLAVDMAATTKYLRVLDRGTPEMRAEAAAIRAQHMGGMLFGNRGLTQRRTLGEIAPALSAKVDAAYSAMVQRLPATRQMAELSGTLLRGGGKVLLAPLDAVFFLTRLGESNIVQRAAFGKLIRHEVQEFTGDWHQTIRLSQQALEDVAKGHTNTPAQHRLLNGMHELVGKYEGYPPWLRAIIQGPAPFLPWALNAARFVYWTMPVHHTALTAYLVRVNDVMQKDWDELHANVPPGMKMAIPTPDGGYLDLARYTPYGLTGPIAQGDLRGLTSQFFPQAGGVEAALQGRDPFGRALALSTHLPPTGGDKAKIAINTALEAFGPYLSTFRRLQEHGETSFADSTVLSPKSKPGTSHGRGAVDRVLNPFRPTYLNAGPQRPAKSTQPAAPVATAAPEDDLWNKVDQVGGDDAEQKAQDELWGKVGG